MRTKTVKAHLNYRDRLHSRVVIRGMVAEAGWYNYQLRAEMSALVGKAATSQVQLQGGERGNASACLHLLFLLAVKRDLDLDANEEGRRAGSGTASYIHTYLTIQEGGTTFLLHIASTTDGWMIEKL